MQTPQPAQNQPDPQKTAEKQRLFKSFSSGAMAFWYIAGLSVVNSLIAIFGGGTFFAIGLGVSLFVDSIASALAAELGGNWVIKVLGLLISLAFAGLFAMFGYFALRLRRWAFVVGLVLYILDTVLIFYLTQPQPPGTIIHLYFLWLIWRGSRALVKLQAMQPVTPPTFPSA